MLHTNINQKKIYLTKEDIQMTNKDMKRCSTSYVKREMQNKTAMSYHHIYWNGQNLGR